MTTAASITWQDRDAAAFMSLRGRCKSPEAVAFVERLMETVVLPAWPEGLQRRPSSIEGQRRALGALLSALLRLQARGEAGKHGMADKDFVGLGFSRDLFSRTKDALIAAGVLKMLGGWQWFTPGFEGSLAPGGKAMVRDSTVSAFRLTSEGLGLAEAAGLLTPDLAAWAEHWEYTPPAVPKPSAAQKAGPALVELKGGRKTVNGRKGDAPALSFNQDAPKPSAVAAELAEHNAFMFARGVGGVPFAGLKRIFNNGDLLGFDWQWGGRFASLPGGGYEKEPKADRLAVMRLAGDRVAEVDLRASQLTILLALASATRGGGDDPYGIDGFDRELVKLWVTQAIGRGDTNAKRWSNEARKYYAEAAPGRTLSCDVDIGEVRTAVLQRHPVLNELWRPEYSVHALNFHESQIISQAMRALREQDVPSLPVHDCLIVPVGAVGAAQGALGYAFNERLTTILGHVPTITVSMKVLFAEDAHW